MSDSPASAGAPAAGELLTIRGLTVGFPTPDGAVQAVRGVDIGVRGGELLAVVGESGSGKSATFLAAMGLLPEGAVVSGSARFDGVELIGASRRVLRSVRGARVAMVFQDPMSALNPVQRVGHQVEEMISAHTRVTRRRAARRAVELLEMVGIAEPAVRARQFPHELSGGMRQRVMIAIAIANSPDLLIADEPTTALDVTVQAQVLDLLARVRHETGMAMILITHDLGVVARVADRVDVMYAGRVVERASVERLFGEPTHPYTAGLLRSLPRGDGARLIPIAGAPPDMIAPPSGCAFRTRCEHAIEACAHGLPDLAPLGDSLTACIRAAELEVVR